MTDNDITTVTEAKPEMILMQRDPERVPGLGMTKMLVPASEVESYKTAGWIEATE